MQEALLPAFRLLLSPLPTARSGGSPQARKRALAGVPVITVMPDLGSSPHPSRSLAFPDLAANRPRGVARASVCPLPERSYRSRTVVRKGDRNALPANCGFFRNGRPRRPTAAGDRVGFRHGSEQGFRLLDAAAPAAARRP